MNQYIIRLTAVLFISVSLLSCKNKAPKETRLIPKDALVVLSLDPLSLKDKLKKSGVSIDAVFNEIFKNDSSNKPVKKWMTDLRQSAGLDWREKVHLYTVSRKATDNADISMVCALAVLKDAEKFSTFIQTNPYTDSHSYEIKKAKDFSYIKAEGNQLIAWDKEHLLVMNYTHKVKPYYDTTKMQFIIPEKVNTDKEMLDEATLLFTQSEEASMMTVKGFADLYHSKAEGYLFNSTSYLLSSFSGLPVQIPKLEELLNNNYTASTLSFEAGKVLITSTTHTNPLLGSILKKYAGPTVNLSLLEHFPSKNINGIFMASFNPAIAEGILKELEVEGMANEFLKKSGLKTQEIFSAFKGDIAVIVSDLGMRHTEPQERDDELSLVKHKAMGKLILTIPVGNKTNFFKLMDKAVETGFLQKKGNNYQGNDLIKTMGLYLSADEQQLIISSDESTCQQYKNKSAKQLISEDVAGQFKGKSSAMFIDITRTLNGFISDSTDKYAKSLIMARNTFKSIRASADNYADEKIKYSFELNLQNQQQNSLLSLISLFSNISKDILDQSKKETELEAKMFQQDIPNIIRAN